MSDAAPNAKDGGIESLRASINAVCSPVFETENERPVPVFTVNVRKGPRSEIDWPCHSHFVFARLQRMYELVDVWFNTFNADQSIYDDIRKLDAWSKRLTAQAVWLDTRDRNSWQNCEIMAGYKTANDVFASGGHRMQKFWGGGCNLRTALPHAMLHEYYGLKPFEADTLTTASGELACKEGRLWIAPATSGGTLKNVTAGTLLVAAGGPRVAMRGFLEAQRPALIEHHGISFESVEYPVRLKAVEPDNTPSP